MSTRGSWLIFHQNKLGSTYTVPAAYTIPRYSGHRGQEAGQMSEEPCCASLCMSSYLSPGHIRPALSRLPGMTSVSSFLQPQVKANSGGQLLSIAASPPSTATLPATGMSPAPLGSAEFSSQLIAETQSSSASYVRYYSNK
jgi:hypothetical protein